MPSAAAQVIVSIIPIVGIVAGSIVLFFYLLWYYKEKYLLIEKGLYHKKEFDAKIFSLFSGLVLFFIGLALIIFYSIKEGLSYSLLGGLIPFSVGISLLIFFIISLVLNKNRQ